MTVIFWICFAIVFYTFIGYGIILLLMLKVKTMFSRTNGEQPPNSSLPNCSVLIAAYNEESFIREKIVNSLSLQYPNESLKIYVVADGSTDKTVQIVKEYPEIILLYSSPRKGKIHAINRAMQYIESDIVVFTDANTYLNKDALLKIGQLYSDQQLGGVAGEKRIYSEEAADASSAGESLYWKYESALKKWDSELNTAIGAAGELFSIRRCLYEHVSESTILDDFIISMRIAQKGFRIAYEPDAYAIETSSSSIQEELKRKIRIAAGGVQSIVSLKSLFNFRKHPLLSFQYISHRVLRWSITPFLLIIVFLLNTSIILNQSALLYESLWLAQLCFYSLAILGYILEKRKLKFKIAFVPYYFCVMNYAIIAGIVKYCKGGQSEIWDKSERKNLSEIDTIELSGEITAINISK